MLFYDSNWLINFLLIVYLKIDSNKRNFVLGLGNKEKYDEVWTRQQENFDSLLAQLNGTDKNDQVEDTINIPSLEDKSKMSKARVQ